MKLRDYKVLATLGFMIAVVVVIGFFIKFFFGVRINPVALTRHAIEECERLDNEIETGINNGSITNNLKSVYGKFVRRSEDFKEGYIRISEDEMPVVLDAWGKPLEIAAKSNLLSVTNASPMLLRKTNTLIIWSSGPNGKNEYGNGDDVFTSP